MNQDDISGRKRMEAAQKNSWDFLSGILDTIADPVFVKGRQHYWVFLNDAFCKFIGHPLESLLGKSDYDFFPKYQADVFWEQDEAVFSNGLESVNEEEFTDACGITHTIIIRKTCYTAADGQQFLVGTIRDITERKRAEALLVQREREFRSLAESTPDFIIRYDRAGHLLYVNAKLARKLGIPAAEMFGKLPIEVWPDGRFSELDRVIVSAMETDAEATVELCEPAANGEFGYVQIWVVPERNAAGQVVGAIAFGRDITDLKRYALSLQERAELERRQSQYFVMAPGLFLTLLKRADGSYAMPFVSEGVRELFGLEPEAVMRDIGALVARAHPDDIEMTFRKTEESERELTPFHVEYRIIHPGKGERWIECNAMPQRMPDGSTRWDGFYHDITERKRLQEQLGQREQELRTLAENQPDVIVRYDLDCRRVYVNQKYAIVNDIPVEAVLGKTPLELSTHMAPLAPAYQKKLQQLIESGEPFETEFSWQGADGNKVLFDVRAFPEFGPDGKVASVLTVARDMSALRQTEETLRNREREFRTLAENSLDTIVRYDRECRFVYANPLFEKLLGVALDELRGKTPMQIPGLPDAEFFQQRVREVIETGRADEFELSIVNFDGTSDWMMSCIAPEFDAQGRVSHVQVVSRNISSLKEAEHNLEESRARLRQLLILREDSHEQERKQISWKMHEDLLQMLAATHLYAKMLQSNSAGMPAQMANMLPSLTSGLDQSIHLVREMVITLRPTVLNLGIFAALDWLADEFAGLHPGLVCKLEVSKEAGLMDEKSSMLVFRIVQESLAFTAKYKASGKVSVSLERDESGYLLAIRDNSKGNNIDLSDSHFLGLYGLQERVLAMGGEMVVFSAPDHGLIIEARLPVLEAESCIH